MVIHDSFTKLVHPWRKYIKGLCAFKSAMKIAILEKEIKQRNLFGIPVLPIM